MAAGARGPRLRRVEVRTLGLAPREATPATTREAAPADRGAVFRVQCPRRCAPHAPCACDGGTEGGDGARRSRASRRSRSAMRPDL